MARLGRLALATAGLAIAGGAAWLLLERPEAVEETAELAYRGSHQALRQPMRPAGGGPRVLVLALDGVGDETLRQALAAGRMPRVAGLLGAAEREPGIYAQGCLVPGMLSVLPSTTVAAWSAIFTGEPPARNGVPGNEWFDRGDGRFYAPAPVSLSDRSHTLQVYTDSLVGNALRTPTLYERADVRSFVTLSQVHRGADLFAVPDPETITDVFGRVALGVLDGETPAREGYSEIDVEAAENALQSLVVFGIPDLNVVYFPGIDLFTHGAADPLPEQQRYLQEILDPGIGRLLDAYARAGAAEQTTVLLLSDHGHTPVMDDDRHAMEAEGDDEPAAVLAQAGFRIRAPQLQLRPEQEDFQAVFAFQGAMAYVYLADRSTCPEPGARCDWRRPPRLAEDVLPVVVAFDAANRAGAGVPELRGALDLILARVGEGESAAFQVFDGEALVPVGEYLARSPRPDLLRLEERLAGLGTGPYGARAGDVLLLARSGGEHPIEEHFYFSSRYRSWHGSPHAQDSAVPLLLARPGASGRALCATASEVLGDTPSQLRVTPLILRLLGKR